MSICVVDGKHCRCSPSEGCPCPALIAERATRPEPDCRTCTRHYTDKGQQVGCSSIVTCTNGDRYQALPPVRLWRTT